MNSRVCDALCFVASLTSPRTQSSLRAHKMVFLTVVVCKIDRNSYFDGTGPEEWVRCLVGIMGNLLYK